MLFSDPQLRYCCESNLAESGHFPDGLRQVGAPLKVCRTSVMFEAMDFACIHRTIDQLHLSALRPGLRRWYERANGDLDRAALVFREHLNDLAGERLEAVENNPNNLS